MDYCPTGPFPKGAGFFFSGATFFIFLALFFPLITLAQVLSPEAATRQAVLQEELAKVEKEIAAQTTLLQAKKKETASLERDVSVLNYQITTAKLNIRAKQLEIERLGSDINKKEATIGTLDERISRGKSSLTESLRQIRLLDDVSAMEVALSGESMSQVFIDLNYFGSLEESLHQSFAEIQGAKTQTKAEKTQLEDRREATINAKGVIERETQKVQALEAQKKNLLAISRNQESGYQAVLADRQKRKQAILSALFQLRDTSAIPFEKALAYAKKAGTGTGVRPAFILAILTQETNLGANVGRCNRPGDPPEKGWRTIMKPTRDHEPFLRIMKALGLDPDTAPLSCDGPTYFGGAMGPSQFIPSTWEIYQARIASVTGHNPPNPWVPEDAFAATAIYLKDLGAAAQTYSAEHRAAAQYYAGSGWATRGQGYASSVMAHAATIQNNIDYLQSN